MRDEELREYRRLLEAQLAELGHHHDAAVHVIVDGREELPDPTDRATQETELEAELRMAERDELLVAQIREALARIDAGTFGNCASCGQPIAEARLRARPVTVMCLECMQDAELASRRGTAA